MGTTEEKMLYSIKDVCIKYGITRKALFYYDRIDLLKPTKREGKQQFKYYDDNALFRLEAILEYRSAGLTIEETKQIIHYFKEIVKSYKDPFYHNFTTGHYKRGVE